MQILNTTLATVTTIGLMAPGVLLLGSAEAVQTPETASAALGRAPEAPATTVSDSRAAKVSAQASGVENAGPWADAYVYNALTGQNDLYTRSSVGYESSPDGTSPRVGEVFYTTMTVEAISGNPLPIMGLAFDSALAPDVSLAISGANPVHCSFRPSVDEPWQDAPTYCSQTGIPTVSGGLGFGARPLSAGQAYKVKVPIQVSQAKSGESSGAAARIYNYTSDLRTTTEYVRAEQTLIVQPVQPVDTLPTIQVGQKKKLPRKQEIRGKTKRVTYKAKTKKVCKLTPNGKKVKGKAVGTCRLKAKPVKGNGRAIVKYSVVAE